VGVTGGPQRGGPLIELPPGLQRLSDRRLRVAIHISEGSKGSRGLHRTELLARDPQHCQHACLEAVLSVPSRVGP